MRFLEEVELFEGAVEIGALFGPGVAGVVLFEIGVGVAKVSIARGQGWSMESAGFCGFRLGYRRRESWIR